jgi:sulfite reductase (NADPH) flavoprotein alpha-component
MAFWYFGYGSNMDIGSLRAKGVAPRASERAVLRRWRLRFNVQHFFRHEGGVGNIERSNNATDAVWGVLHEFDDEALGHLDAAEACGHGYDRVELPVLTDHSERRAHTYVGAPSFLDDACLPTQRYLNILLRGATAAGLDPAYVDALRRHPTHQRRVVPQFAPPAGDHQTFTAATLTRDPPLTALAGNVFDMSRARWRHRPLCGLFGGKDMTLFHLQRLDSSTGDETLADVKHDRLDPAQRQYLNEYLHEYLTEYAYVGRYIYE